MISAGTSGTPMPIRVVIADDQPLLRSALVNLLDSETDIEVVAEADTGAAAVSAVSAALPDVVIMDIRMPDMDGITATSMIVDDPDTAATRVLILTTFEVEEYIVGALRAGASGFLAKDADPAEIVRAVRVVASGDALLSPAATPLVVARFLSQPERMDSQSDTLESLTDRERRADTGGARVEQRRNRRCVGAESIDSENACEPDFGPRPVCAIAPNSISPCLQDRRCATRHQPNLTVGCGRPRYRHVAAPLRLWRPTSQE